MRWTLAILILIGSVTYAEPHLLLNFDINKTLIAQDKATNKSVEDTLNQLLAEKTKACWDDTLLEPISYQRYVGILLPGREDDLPLKKRRLEYLNHFVDHLKDQNHLLYQEVASTYHTALNILQESGGKVFPSFYRLINELDKKDISYSIILRSYGVEVFEVAEEIKLFQNKVFSRFGTFREGKLSTMESEKMHEEPYAVYEVLRSSGHLAIQDDWKHWVKGKMEGKYGKPFYIDQEDPDTISFFFDDNIYLDDRKENIVAPINAKTGEVIPISSLITSSQIVSVDTLEAILDENYFLDLIEKALKE